MAGAELVESRIQGGRWSGLVRLVGASPGFAVSLDGEELAGLSEEPAGKGLVRLTLDLPSRVISEGMRMFLVRPRGAAEPLGRFVLFAGQAIDGDALAEIALLRAELDLLKAAFRRRFVDAGG